jgi:hypothetical protein
LISDGPGVQANNKLNDIAVRTDQRIFILTVFPRQIYINNMLYGKKGIEMCFSPGTSFTRGIIISVIGIVA